MWSTFAVCLGCDKTGRSLKHFIKCGCLLEIWQKWKTSTQIKFWTFRFRCNIKQKKWIFCRTNFPQFAFSLELKNEMHPLCAHTHTLCAKIYAISSPPFSFFLILWHIHWLLVFRRFTYLRVFFRDSTSVNAENTRLCVTITQNRPVCMRVNEKEWESRRRKGSYCT